MRFLVADLVERCGPSERPQGRIARDRKVFLSPDYKEEQLRAEFLNPFESLGWDHPMRCRRSPSMPPQLALHPMATQKRCGRKSVMATELRTSLVAVGRTQETDMTSPRCLRRCLES